MSPIDPLSPGGQAYGSSGPEPPHDPAHATGEVSQPAVNEPLAVQATALAGQLDACKPADLHRLGERLERELAAIERDSSTWSLPPIQPGPRDGPELIARRLVTNGHGDNEALLQHILDGVCFWMPRQQPHESLREAVLQALNARSPHEPLEPAAAQAIADRIAGSVDPPGVRDAIGLAVRNALLNTPIAATEPAADSSPAAAPPMRGPNAQATIETVLARLAAQREEMLAQGRLWPSLPTVEGAPEQTLSALLRRGPRYAQRTVAGQRLLEAQAGLVAALQEAVRQREAGVQASPVERVQLAFNIGFHATRHEAAIGVHTALTANLAGAVIAWRPADVVAMAQLRQAEQDASRAALEAVHRNEQAVLETVRDLALAYGSQLAGQEYDGADPAGMAARQEMLDIALLARTVLTYYPERALTYPLFAQPDGAHARAWAVKADLPLVPLAPRRQVSCGMQGKFIGEMAEQSNRALNDTAGSVDGATGVRTSPRSCQRAVTEVFARTVCVAQGEAELIQPLRETLAAFEANGPDGGYQGPVGPVMFACALDALVEARQLYAEAHQIAWHGGADTPTPGDPPEDRLERVHARVERADHRLVAARQYLLARLDPADFMASGCFRAADPVHLPPLEAAVWGAGQAVVERMPFPVATSQGLSLDGLPPPPERLQGIADRIGRFGPFEPMPAEGPLPAALAALDRLFAAEGPRDHLAQDMPDWMRAATARG